MCLRRGGRRNGNLSLVDAGYLIRIIAMRGRGHDSSVDVEIIQLEFRTTMLSVTDEVLVAISRRLRRAGGPFLHVCLGFIH